MTLRASEEMKQEYRAILESCRITQSDTPIPNRFPFHGQIAVSQLLKLAIHRQYKKKKLEQPTEVSIITGTAPDHVYCPDDIDLFPEFLDKGGNVRVIVWNETLECGKNLLSLATQYKSKGQFEIRLSRTKTMGDQISHFLLVDEIGYRLESPHKAFEGIEFSDYFPEIHARICFNDPDGAKRLRSYFGTMWGLLPESSV